MTIYADSLAERAAQRRALAVSLVAQCPDPLHWHAHPGVPCTPPDDAYPWGWTCIPRFEFAQTVQESRRLARRHEDHVQATRRREWQARREARERASVTARIAAATPRAKEPS